MLIPLRKMFRARPIYFTLFTLVASTLSLHTALAGDGKLTCQIYERNQSEKISYTVEVRSKENHTVYIYDRARIIPNFYLRVSGLVGGGAHFLQFNVEDLKTGQMSIAKYYPAGKLMFGSNRVFVELNCEAVSD